MKSLPDTTNRSTTTSRPVTGRTRTLVIFLDRLIFQLSKHWLFVFNVFTGIYAGLPFLAPVFMARGLTSWGQLIYTIYDISGCHQLPWRSFFFFGARHTYSYQTLVEIVGAEPFMTLQRAQKFYGTPALGYKVAHCQRDTAIYAAIFLAGLFFALFRHRMNPMPWSHFLLAVLPLGVDGIGQLFGLWESTPLSRVVSGGLFGIALVWLAYPFLEQGMDDVRHTLSKRFGWK
ncbi:MAG: DUF2085 domain-containing protein [Chloroflexota bacterium]|nr:DUF2085 domain-containing protein [Chloroflexota bacterium]